MCLPPATVRPYKFLAVGQMRGNDENGALSTLKLLKGRAVEYTLKRVADRKASTRSTLSASRLAKVHWYVDVRDDGCRSGQVLSSAVNGSVPCRPPPVPPQWWLQPVDGARTRPECSCARALQGSSSMSDVYLHMNCLIICFS